MSFEASIAAAGIVPVMTVEEPEVAALAGAALVRGDVPCLEVAFRTEAAVDALRAAAEVEGLLPGAGTLVAPEQVDAAVEAGARFGAAPGTDEAVVARALELGLPFLPGVATPTEIGRARALGFSLQKLFPGAPLGGPAFLRALAGPFPDVRFVVTGGIDAGNAADFLALSNVVAVGGSWLVAPAREHRWDEIERLARASARG